LYRTYEELKPSVMLLRVRKYACNLYRTYEELKHLKKLVSFFQNQNLYRTYEELKHKEAPAAPTFTASNLYRTYEELKPKHFNVFRNIYIEFVSYL